MTAKRRIVFVGGRPDGHGNVAVETARACPDVEVAGFLDDAPKAKSVAGAAWLGPTATWREIAAQGGVAFHVAVGDNPIRRRIAMEILAGGGALASVVHPAAHVAPSARIGDGTLVCAGAIVGPGARIGRDCIVNHGAIVEHDGAVADHVNLSTGFACGGRARIEEGAFAGVGAVLIPDVRVARWTYLAAGAVVVKDTEPHGLYAGVPARLVRTLGTDDAPASP
jgi:acetyltransferase EpsM